MWDRKCRLFASKSSQKASEDPPFTACKSEMSASFSFTEVSSLLKIPKLEADWKQLCSATRSFIVDVEGSPQPDGASLYQNRLPQLAERLATLLEGAATGRGGKGLPATHLIGE